MKRFISIAKWTGITMIMVLAILFSTVMMRQDLKFEAPYPNIKASKDTAIINRGKHLVYNVAHCADCHSKVDPDSILALGEEVTLTGGRAFHLPIATIYSANITADPVHGIGKMSDAQIARSLRFGVRADGTALLDFMPFHNLSDEDLTAIISYLRTQKPVAIPKPENEFNMLGKAIKAFMVKPVGPSEKIQPKVEKDSSVAYGKYLAMNAANCAGCHTQRGLSGEYTGELLAGGGVIDGMVTPNLTPDTSGRLTGWTPEVFVSRFRMGKLDPKSPMPWNSFKRMSDDELKAIYYFLKSVKPAKTPELKERS
jgi:mono/diheme cytochrome c family protein